MKKISKTVIWFIALVLIAGCTSDAYLMRYQALQVAGNAVYFNTSEQSGGDLRPNRDCGRDLTVVYDEESLRQLRVSDIGDKERRIELMATKARAREINHGAVACAVGKPYRDTLTEVGGAIAGTIGGSAILGVSFPKNKADRISLSNDSSSRSDADSNSNISDFSLSGGSNHTNIGIDVDQQQSLTGGNITGGSYNSPTNKPPSNRPPDNRPPSNRPPSKGGWR